MFLAFGCKDDDSRDDTILDMDNVVGKDWYYNAWMGNKEGMETPDLLEVVRLEKGGQLKSVEFGGRQETTVGTWLKDGNRLTMQYTDGETVTWDVLHSGEDYLQVLTNEGGRREYRSSLDYLGELTADAFLMNEYSEYDNQYRTYIAADVRGNIDVREGMLLLGNGGNVALENHEYYWSAQNAYEIQDLDENRNVRFYVRIGKDNHVKLSDSIYTENLAHRSPAEMDLQVNTNGSEIDVTWNPYVGQQVYYRVDYPGIDSTANLRGYLKSLFSDDLVEMLLPYDGTQYIDIDGVLYGLDGGRGTDITRGAETVQVLRDGDPDRCTVRVTVEVVDPEQDNAVVNTLTFDFPYEKVGEKWIFTDFSLVR